MKINGFSLKKRQEAETITDEESANDIILLTNTPAQAEPMHNLKQAARRTDLFANSDKTQFICFNQDGATFSLNGKPLKKVDLFIYFSGNITSTEKTVFYTDLGKVLSAIDRLMTLRKFDLSDNLLMY